MMKKLLKKLRLLKNDEGGTALILVTAALPMIFGMAAFCVDLGYMYYIGSRLQNASDIAALAGGTKLVKGDKAAVESQALDFLKLNLPSNWDIVDSKGALLSGTGKSSIKITPQIQAKCSPKLEAAGLPCYAAPGLVDKINYLEISLGAKAPLFFASGIGFHKASLTSDSIVTADGSTMPPLNVAIILDSTASMIDPNDKTTACGNVSMTKLACAKQAALGMVGTLWPVVDHVAIYTYPGLSQGTGASPDLNAANSNAAKNVCSTGTPTVADYFNDTNPARYKVVDYKDDYRTKTSPPAPGVIVTSPIVQALGGSTLASGHTTNCTGIQVGTITGATYKNDYKNIIHTFFADSVDAAQKDLKKINEDLAANGETTRQNVIVILSDGDANAPDTANSSWPWPAMIETARHSNQCLAAITSAQAATAAGTWVYSVAYNAGTTKGGTCKLDTSTVTTNRVIVTTSTKTVTYTQSYSNSQRKCGGVSQNTVTNTTNQTMNASDAPSPSVTGPTRSPPNPPSCSSTNKNVSYTDTTVTVTVAATTPLTSTNNDRTACDTMRLMASTPDKFYSVDKAGSGGCVSSANPTTTDLLAIFKRVAVSMMTKRRAPKSAI